VHLSLTIYIQLQYVLYHLSNVKFNSRHSGGLLSLIQHAIILLKHNLYLYQKYFSMISGEFVAYFEVVDYVCVSQSYYIYLFNLQYVLYHLYDIEFNSGHSGDLF
jgi:hypothetical protein